jgi:DNA-binding Lrp family transcriptional regulator
MDDLDESIFRALLGGRHPLLGGVDPRLSAQELGRRVGADRTTVWSRVRRWERSGFYEGFEVIPNPQLFGARIGAGSLRVESPRARALVLRELSDVDGVVAAVEQTGLWVVAWVVAESPSGFERLSDCVRQLVGVAEATPCRPLWPVPPEVLPSHLDWRIVRELRAFPRPSLSRVAHRLRITPRTMTRRYQRLVSGGAVWFVPRFNFERSARTFAMFNVYLTPGTDPRQRSTAIIREIPHHVVTFDGSAWSPEPPPPIVVSFGLLEAAAQAAHVEESLVALPGVADVETFFPRRAHMFPRWFDVRLAEALAPAPGAADRGAGKNGRGPAAATREGIRARRSGGTPRLG